jgi:hypothetical protein
MTLRVRLGHPLNSDETKIKASFRGRRIIIQSRQQEKPLKDSEWVVLLATRFKTVEKAVEYEAGAKTRDTTPGTHSVLPMASKA